MLQLYFLSVLTTLLTGVVLAFQSKDDTTSIITKNQVFILILGIATAVVGILKLFIFVR